MGYQDLCEACKGGGGERHAEGNLASNDTLPCVSMLGTEARCCARGGDVHYCIAKISASQFLFFERRPFHACSYHVHLSPHTSSFPLHSSMHPHTLRLLPAPTPVCLCTHPGRRLCGGRASATPADVYHGSTRLDDEKGSRAASGQATYKL